MIKLLSSGGISPCMLDGAKTFCGVGQVGLSRGDSQKWAGSFSLTRGLLEQAA